MYLKHAPSSRTSIFNTPPRLFIPILHCHLTAKRAPNFSQTRGRGWVKKESGGVGEGRMPLHLQPQCPYQGVLKGPYACCFCWQVDILKRSCTGLNTLGRGLTKQRKALTGSWLCVSIVDGVLMHAWGTSSHV